MGAPALAECSPRGQISDGDEPIPARTRQFYRRGGKAQRIGPPKPAWPQASRRKPAANVIQYDIEYVGRHRLPPTAKRAGGK
jgi:hypothetical protein